MFRIRWAPETGWGLYAGPEGVPKGTRLAYTGRGVSRRGDSAYVMQTRRGLVDAADPEGRIVWEDGSLSEPVGRLLPCGRVGVGYVGAGSDVARFVNHGVPPNARLGPGYYLTTRRIPPGEQLLANYGRSYWRPRGLLGERVRLPDGREATVVRRLPGEHRWRLALPDGERVSASLGPTDRAWELLGGGGSGEARMVWDGRALSRAVLSRGRWRFQRDGSPVPAALRWRAEVTGT